MNTDFTYMNTSNQMESLLFNFLAYQRQLKGIGQVDPTNLTEQISQLINLWPSSSVAEDFCCCKPQNSVIESKPAKTSAFVPVVRKKQSSESLNTQNKVFQQIENSAFSR